jgi:hypothetical protein
VLFVVLQALFSLFVLNMCHIHAIPTAIPSVSGEMSGWAWSDMGRQMTIRHGATEPIQLMASRALRYETACELGPTMSFSLIFEAIAVERENHCCRQIQARPHLIRIRPKCQYV